MVLLLNGRVKTMAMSISNGKQKYLLGPQAIAHIKNSLEKNDQREAEVSLTKILKAFEPPSPGDSIGRNWEPLKIAYLTVAVLLRECSSIFTTQPIIDLLIKWLEPNLPCGLSNAVLACTCLNVALMKSENVQKTIMVEALVKDILESGSSHRWNDHAECRVFVLNLRSIWQSAPPPSDDDTLLISSNKELKNIERRKILHSMLELVRQRTSKLESADSTVGGGGILSLLKDWIPHSAAAREETAKHCDRWLSSPSKVDRAQALLKLLTEEIIKASKDRKIRKSDDSLSAIDIEEGKFDDQAVIHLINMRLKSSQQHLLVETSLAFLDLDLEVIPFKHIQDVNSLATREVASVTFSLNDFLVELFQSIIRSELSDQMSHSSHSYGGGNNSVNFVESMISSLFTTDRSSKKNLSYLSSQAFGRALHIVLQDTLKSSVNPSHSSHVSLAASSSSSDKLMTKMNSLRQCITKLLDLIFKVENAPSSNTEDTQSTPSLMCYDALINSIDKTNENTNKLDKKDVTVNNEGLDLLLLIKHLIPAAPEITDSQQVSCPFHHHCIDMALHMMSIKEKYQFSILSFEGTSSYAEYNASIEMLLRWGSTLKCINERNLLFDSMATLWCTSSKDETMSSFLLTIQFLQKLANHDFPWGGVKVDIIILIAKKALQCIKIEEERRIGEKSSDIFINQRNKLTSGVLTMIEDMFSRAAKTAQKHHMIMRKTSFPFANLNKSSTIEVEYDRFVKLFDKVNSYSMKVIYNFGFKHWKDNVADDKVCEQLSEIMFSLSECQAPSLKKLKSNNSSLNKRCYDSSLWWKSIKILFISCGCLHLIPYNNASPQSTMKTSLDQNSVQEIFHKRASSWFWYLWRHFEVVKMLIKCSMVDKFNQNVQFKFTRQPPLAISSDVQLQSKAPVASLKLKKETKSEVSPKKTKTMNESVPNKKIKTASATSEVTKKTIMKTEVKKELVPWEFGKKRHIAESDDSDDDVNGSNADAVSSGGVAIKESQPTINVSKKARPSSPPPIIDDTIRRSKRERRKIYSSSEDEGDFDIDDEEEEDEGAMIDVQDQEFVMEDDEEFDIEEVDKDDEEFKPGNRKSSRKKRKPKQFVQSTSTAKQQHSSIIKEKELLVSDPLIIYDDLEFEMIPQGVLYQLERINEIVGLRSALFTCSSNYSEFQPSLEYYNASIVCGCLNDEYKNDISELLIRERVEGKDSVPSWLIPLLCYGPYPTHNTSSSSSHKITSAAATHVSSDITSVVDLSITNNQRRRSMSVGQDSVKEVFDIHFDSVAFEWNEFDKTCSLSLLPTLTLLRLSFELQFSDNIQHTFKTELKDVDLKNIHNQIVSKLKTRINQSNTSMTKESIEANCLIVVRGILAELSSSHQSRRNAATATMKDLVLVNAVDTVDKKSSGWSSALNYLNVISQSSSSYLSDFDKGVIPLSYPIISTFACAIATASSVEVNIARRKTWIDLLHHFASNETSLSAHRNESESISVSLYFTCATMIFICDTLDFMFNEQVFNNENILNKSSSSSALISSSSSNRMDDGNDSSGDEEVIEEVSISETTTSSSPSFFFSSEIATMASESFFSANNNEQLTSNQFIKNDNKKHDMSVASESHAFITGVNYIKQLCHSKETKNVKQIHSILTSILGNDKLVHGKTSTNTLFINYKSHQVEISVTLIVGLIEIMLNNAKRKKQSINIQGVEACEFDDTFIKAEHDLCHILLVGNTCPLLEESCMLTTPQLWWSPWLTRSLLNLSCFDVKHVKYSLQILSFLPNKLLPRMFLYGTNEEAKPCQVSSLKALEILDKINNVKKYDLMLEQFNNSNDSWITSNHSNHSSDIITQYGLPCCRFQSIELACQALITGIKDTCLDSSVINTSVFYKWLQEKVNDDTSLQIEKKHHTFKSIIMKYNSKFISSEDEQEGKENVGNIEKTALPFRDEIEMGLVDKSWLDIESYVFNAKSMINFSKMKAREYLSHFHHFITCRFLIDKEKDGNTIARFSNFTKSTDMVLLFIHQFRVAFTNNLKRLVWFNKTVKTVTQPKDEISITEVSEQCSSLIGWLWLNLNDKPNRDIDQIQNEMIFKLLFNRQSSKYSPISGSNNTEIVDVKLSLNEQISLNNAMCSVMTSFEKVQGLKYCLIKKDSLVTGLNKMEESVLKMNWLLYCVQNHSLVDMDEQNYQHQISTLMTCDGLSSNLDSDMNVIEYTDLPCIIDWLMDLVTHKVSLLATDQDVIIERVWKELKKPIEIFLMMMSQVATSTSNTEAISIDYLKSHINFNFNDETTGQQIHEQIVLGILWRFYILNPHITVFDAEDIDVAIDSLAAFLSCEGLEEHSSNKALIQNEEENFNVAQNGYKFMNDHNYFCSHVSTVSFSSSSSSSLSPSPLPSLSDSVTMLQVVEIVERVVSKFTKLSLQQSQGLMSQFPTEDADKLSEIAASYPLLLLPCIPALTQALLNDAEIKGHNVLPSSESRSGSGGGGQREVKRICFMFEKDGTCARGMNCKFSHDSNVNSEGQNDNKMLLNGGFPRFENYPQVPVLNYKATNKQEVKSSNQGGTMISVRHWGSSYHESFWLSVVNMLTQFSPSLLLSKPAHRLGASLFLMTLAKLISIQISISELKSELKDMNNQGSPELTSELRQIRLSIKFFLDICEKETPDCFVEEGPFKESLAALLAVCPPIDA